MVVPGLIAVLVLGVLQLLKRPLMKLLGLQPVQNEDALRSFGQSPFQQPSVSAPDATLQALMENATPEEREQLRALQERMQARGAPSPSGGGAAPSQWVTPAPNAAPGAAAVTPEQRREMARQRARGQAQTEVQEEITSNTKGWVSKQTQADQAMASQFPQSYTSLEEDQKLVAVASVVLTAFVVAEADNRGYQTS